MLSRWHDNLLLLCSKTVPLNGLAWLAGVWPATFSGTNKTDCSATWRAKINYALVLMMEKFLKSNSVHGYLLHKMCIMHSALPEICTILYLVYTKRRRTDAVGTIDGVLKSLHCISFPWRHPKVYKIIIKIIIIGHKTFLRCHLLLE